MKIGFQGCQWRLGLRNAKENWACWIGANENWTLRESDFTFVKRSRDHKYDARCMNDILWLMHSLMLEWCKMQDTWWMFRYAMMDTMWCIVWCIHDWCKMHDWYVMMCPNGCSMMLERCMQDAWFECMKCGDCSMHTMYSLSTLLDSYNVLIEQSDIINAWQWLTWWFECF
jgi:hypothetical protein